jgi:isoamylase
VEGPTDDLNVEALRNRQVKNFFAVILLVAGTPMILMGDEVRRTQRGNNNAFCQDSDISWFDWSLLERHGDIYRFVKSLNEFRQRRDVVVAEETALSLNEFLRRARIEWHGVALKRPDWSDQSHSLAFTLRTLRARLLLHGMLNAYWEPLMFELPPVRTDRQQRWRRCIDTVLDSPYDICPWETAPVVTQATYVAQPRSVVLLALALEGSPASVPEVE